MFEARALGDHLERIRDDHAPGALVLDAERDFETLPPAQAEQLGLLVESLDPVTYPGEWLPEAAPDILRQYAGGEFTVGMPGDGGVVWTAQTEPPVVIVKPRLEGSPEHFVDFLLANALVEAGLGEPEHLLGFFRERYRSFHDAAGDALDPVGVYQVAAACYDAYLGLQTRDVFAGWQAEYPDLFRAWVDAGDRLEPRLSELAESMATGRTSFGDAAELACSAVKHASEIPAPFDALDAEVYRDHGPGYAVEWLARTVDALD
jgi:hypothetical protein